MKSSDYAKLLRIVNRLLLEIDLKEDYLRRISAKNYDNSYELSENIENMLDENYEMLEFVLGLLKE